jgi:hypothetical protein
MKKITIIGDVHGRNIWKQIVNKELDSDKIIFLGDYFDSWDIDPIDQIENFKDIIEYKKNNIDKVILLLGNHDYFIDLHLQSKISGFNGLYSYRYQELIKDSIKHNYTKMLHIEDNYMFSHAGLSRIWLKNIGFDFINGDVETFVNDLLIYKPNSFDFTPGKRYNPYGDDTTQPPTWIRRPSLANCRYGDYIHVIGHTNTKKVEYLKKQHILMCDCQNEYVTIINNEIIINEINKNNTI